jgi:NADH-ubiquinone oxidoreductase chain 6
VIMMFNIKLSDIVNTKEQINANMAFVFAITVLFIYIIKWILPFAVNDIYSLPTLFLHQTNNFLINSNITLINDVLNTFNPNTFDFTFSNFLQIETLGLGLYTYGASLLTTVSIVLLLSMLAPILLSGKFKHLQNNEKYHNE